MWCDVKFRQTREVKPEDINQEAKSLDREDIVAKIPSGASRFAQVEGEGVTLRCYTQLEVMYGQHVFCVDFLIKEAQDS